MGGLVLLVLISIGISEIVRKTRSKHDCSRASGTSHNGHRSDVHPTGDAATSRGFPAMAANPQPLLRAARMHSTAHVEEEGAKPAAETRKAPPTPELEEAFNDAFMPSDGVAFALAPSAKLKNTEELKRIVSRSGSFGRQMTQSDSGTQIGSKGLSRQIGRSDSVANMLRHEKGSQALLIDPQAQAVAFQSTDAYVTARQHMRNAASQHA